MASGSFGSMGRPKFATTTTTSTSTSMVPAATATTPMARSQLARVQRAAPRRVQQRQGERQGQGAQDFAMLQLRRQGPSRASLYCTQGRGQSSIGISMCSVPRVRTQQGDMPEQRRWEIRRPSAQRRRIREISEFLRKRGMGKRQRQGQDLRVRRLGMGRTSRLELGARRLAGSGEPASSRRSES